MNHAVIGILHTNIQEKASIILAGWKHALAFRLFFRYRGVSIHPISHLGLQEKITVEVAVDVHRCSVHVQNTNLGVGEIFRCLPFPRYLTKNRSLPDPLLRLHTRHLGQQIRVKKRKSYHAKAKPHTEDPSAQPRNEKTKKRKSNGNRGTDPRHCHGKISRAKGAREK